MLAWAELAQGQIVTESHPELGLRLTRPVHYSGVPVPPRETRIRLSYGEPGTSKRLAVVVLDAGDEPADTRGYLAQVLQPDSFEVLRSGASRFGMRPARFRFERRDRHGAALEGLLLGWEGEQRSVLILGEAHAALFVDESRHWERVAETLRIQLPRQDERERNRWTRFYSQRRFLGAERRIEERLDLVEPWTARDTKHYLVLGNTPNGAFLDRVAADLEILRPRLVADFPATGPGNDAAAVVRVCADREEYLAYGGISSGQGYFSASEAELVLYVGDSEANTLQTVYHEAFHQYVYHSSGEVAPASWFDEGVSEFYAGARIRAGRVTGVEPLMAHISFLQQAQAAGELRSVEALMGLSQAAYYANPALHYAQGWGLVSFLRSSPEARRNRQWSGLLERYYQALGRAWEVEHAAWPAAVARERARMQAHQAAIRGVDIDRLDGAYRDWIRGFVQPK